jgi:RNA 3'-terminal phosphate cyclase (ATP)
MAKTERIIVDGSYGEGGGQIIRTAVSLAAMTGRAVEVVNVRARRSRPGLQPQHLMAVKSAAQTCAAILEGADPGSTRFAFEPQAPVAPGDYRFDIGTAGATALVGQTLLMPLSHAEGSSKAAIKGGTHVPQAPAADYLVHVYAPALRRFGLEVKVDYASAGFFPKGGGWIGLTTEGHSRSNAVDLTDRGKLTRLRAFVITSNLPDHVAERGAAVVERFMKGIGRPVEVERRNLPSPGAGAAVVLVAECENGFAGFTGLGERGKPMEKVAEAPCEEFLRWWKSGAACDEQLADQLVLPAAFASGESRWTTPVVTEHLRTVIWLVEHFLPIQHRIEEQETHSLVTLTGVPP